MDKPVKNIDERRERIGYNLKRIRLMRGLKAKDVADMYPCHKTQISALERGHRDMGSQVERRLAEIYQVNSAEFHKPIDPVMREMMDIIDSEEGDKTYLLEALKDARLLHNIKNKPATN